MCYYARKNYRCGDWRWGNLKLRCPRQHRIGEVCGAKLVDTDNVTEIDDDCKLCQEIMVKQRRLERERDNIARWRRENPKFLASIEKAQRQATSLEETIADMTSRRTSVVGRHYMARTNPAPNSLNSCAGSCREEHLNHQATTNRIINSAREQSPVRPRDKMSTFQENGKPLAHKKTPQETGFDSRPLLSPGSDDIPASNCERRNSPSRPPNSYIAPVIIDSRPPARKSVSYSSPETAIQVASSKSTPHRHTTLAAISMEQKEANAEAYLLKRSTGTPDLTIEALRKRSLARKSVSYSTPKIVPKTVIQTAPSKAITLPSIPMKQKDADVEAYLLKRSTSNPDLTIEAIRNLDKVTSSSRFKTGSGYSHKSHQSSSKDSSPERRYTSGKRTTITLPGGLNVSIPANYMSEYRPLSINIGEVTLSMNSRDKRSEVPVIDDKPRPHNARDAAPSDSGYRSGMGTDTESICSMESSGSSLGLTQDFLDEFIAFFGDTLIEKAGARAWAGCALEKHPPEFVEQRINVFLKDYTVELSAIGRGPSHDETHAQIASGAIKLIRRYRPKVARYFRENVLSAPVAPDSMSSRLEELGKQLSVSEKLALFARASSVETSAAIEEDDESEDDEGYEDDTDYSANLKPIQDFLVSGTAFTNLARSMRRELYCDEQLASNPVTTYMLASLSAARYFSSQDYKTLTKRNQSIFKASFIMHWDLLGYLKSQFGSHQKRIGSVVVLTGSALYAHGTTCSEYLQSTWPSNGLEFLSALQDAVIDSCTDNDRRKRPEYTFLDGSSISFAFSQPSTPGKSSTMEVTTHATKETLIDIAQQLAWIGAALNTSPYGEKLAYCNAAFQELQLNRTSSSLNFTMTFDYTTLHATEEVCWLPLFCGTTIARGFPIPQRQDEMGLEIPLAMMAAIAGARRAVEYEGGVVMKGFSCMFVPIKRNAGIVQWHLISSPDCEQRLSYRKVLDRCQDRASLQEVNLESLRTTRAIVGWCTKAYSLLGSDEANYENILYSTAQDAASSLKFAGGSIGFQQFAMAQLDFTLGPKDGKCHFARKGPYERVISAADRTPVVLYDTIERRGWLVPASQVLLHLAHSKNWQEPFMVKGEQVKLFTTGPSGLSTKQALLKGASLNLSDYEKYTFMDLVLDLWETLEFLLDQNVRSDRTPGTALSTKMKETIQGFEFKSIVEDRSPFRRKQWTIEKTNGGWPALVREIDALVLFASGFENVIKPLSNEDDHALCMLWRTVPKRKDYLATSVRLLNQLYDVAGCGLDRMFLTSSRLQLHRGRSSLFEPCQTPTAYRCSCVRLQQVVPQSAKGDVTRPDILSEDGAVIFGQAESAVHEMLFSPTRARHCHLYSQANISLLPPPIAEEDNELSVCPSDVGVQQSQTLSDTTESSLATFRSQASLESIDTSMTELTIDSDARMCPNQRPLPDEVIQFQRINPPWGQPNPKNGTRYSKRSNAASFEDIPMNSRGLRTVIAPAPASDKIGHGHETPLNVGARHDGSDWSSRLGSSTTLRDDASAEATSPPWSFTRRPKHLKNAETITSAATNPACAPAMLYSRDVRNPAGAGRTLRRTGHL